MIGNQKLLRLFRDEDSTPPVPIELLKAHIEN